MVEIGLTEFGFGAIGIWPGGRMIVAKVRLVCPLRNSWGGPEFEIGVERPCCTRDCKRIDVGL